MPFVMWNQGFASKVHWLSLLLASVIVTLPQLALAQPKSEPSAVIQNSGKKKILVLAGTVVKGGNQDRQVARDFIIGAHKTVPIDAFCVEQGRWTGSRNGEATGGKFAALDTFAMSRVRVATLDSADVKARRERLSSKVNSFLAAAPQKKLVGVAYAVDGKVRSVRWFMSHQVFGMFRAPLVNTAVVEALTSQAALKSAGKKHKKHSMHPVVVANFVKKIALAKKSERSRKADSSYHYNFSDDAAGGKMMYAPSPAAKPKTVTEDYSAY